MTENKLVSLLNSTQQSKQSARVCIIHFIDAKECMVKPLSERAFKTVVAAKDIRSSSANPLHRLDNICRRHLGFCIFASSDNVV
jgi:hypothetical protein